MCILELLCMYHYRSRNTSIITLKVPLSDERVADSGSRPGGIKRFCVESKIVLKGFINESNSCWAGNGLTMIWWLIMSLNFTENTPWFILWHVKIHFLYWLVWQTAELQQITLVVLTVTVQRSQIFDLFIYLSDFQILLSTDNKAYFQGSMIVFSHSIHEWTMRCW